MESTTESENLVYLFDFLFVRAGAGEEVCLHLYKLSTLCIQLLEAFQARFSSLYLQHTAAAGSELWRT